MNNYMNNSIQYDNNNMLTNQQTMNIYPSTNTNGLFIQKKTNNLSVV